MGEVKRILKSPILLGADVKSLRTDRSDVTQTQSDPHKPQTVAKTQKLQVAKLHKHNEFPHADALRSIATSVSVWKFSRGVHGKSSRPGPSENKVFSSFN